MQLRHTPDCGVPIVHASGAGVAKQPGEALLFNQLQGWGVDSLHIPNPSADQEVTDMRHAQPRQYFASNQRAIANADAIEWEELPSLAKRLVNRETQGRGANDSRFQNSMSFDTPWGATMPAALDPAPTSQPFVERIAGLASREVIEPDVFLHFFGPNAD
ncbi:MAG: hypothetical protein ABI887_20665 [Burkholderiales bacterium]